MSRSREMPLAEVSDRRWELMAVAVFLMALKSMASAALAVVDGPWVRYLDWFEAGTALAAVGIVLWLMFIKLTRVPRADRRRFLNMESYVGDTVKAAMFRSWGTTFILLTLLGTFGDRWLTTAPTEFFIHLSVALMLCVFSVSFFILNRSVDDVGAAGA